MYEDLIYQTTNFQSTVLFEPISLNIPYLCMTQTQYKRTEEGALEMT